MSFERNGANELCESATWRAIYVPIPTLTLLIKVIYFRTEVVRYFIIMHCMRLSHLTKRFRTEVFILYEIDRDRRTHLT